MTEIQNIFGLTIMIVSVSHTHSVSPEDNGPMQVIVDAECHWSLGTFYVLCPL